ncbi:hypothetical protein B296_00059110 [Ensete ventricosum]|uniref:Uncharacterized protein n=1 Tax=Ensete ventricosum TaxID=4639 RepID=A0A426WVD4_ENSVE|nr:hypothetical protein B296_00059110 [Ensete ventricosum]
MFRSIFCALTESFKILAIPIILAHGKSYKHSFVKKYDGHKLCAKSHSKLRFDHFSCTVLEFQNTSDSQCISPWEVIRARFREIIRRS